MTSFIAAGGSGRSTSVIPAVPAAWSVTTIAFIVPPPCAEYPVVYRRTHWSSKHALSVLRIGNTTRVRDGYNRLSTHGHARASATQSDLPIYRENVPADAPPCPP